jgi:hypothetical protein
MLRFVAHPLIAEGEASLSDDIFWPASEAVLTHRFVWHEVFQPFIQGLFAGASVWAVFRRKRVLFQCGHISQMDRAADL